MNDIRVVMRPCANVNQTEKCPPLAEVLAGKRAERNKGVGSKKLV